MPPAGPTRLQDRYELREPLGRGGMGVVYSAWDRLMNRHVALKTLLEIDNRAALELFYKEWGVLANMVHPNIISIYDIGEFEQGGAVRPFFVMPLLTGCTLEKLIRDKSPRLGVENVVGIAIQTARGLQAVHEQGLVHRDVKPANIWIMDDDAVKIIDFGIAHLASAGSRTTLKGTVSYMAPEQLQAKPPSPLSDQFSLGAVCYECLTGTRPFLGASETQLVEAILRGVPPPASELNHLISPALAKVIHKAMARGPSHRFSSAREFADALQRASRGELPECFEPAKVAPRLERAKQSFEQGDYGFAGEILGELEGEGQVDQHITLLRRQLDQAVRRSRLQQLLEGARRFFDAGEYTLALRKAQQALELDPADPDASALKSQIEKRRRESEIEESLQLARGHLANLSLPQARRALDSVLQTSPTHTEALRLLAAVERQEQELAEARAEKAQLYQAAMQAWDRGDLKTALNHLEALMKLDREVPEIEVGSAGAYQAFYDQVRAEHDAVTRSCEEARSLMEGGDLDAAATICRQRLTKYPSHALFLALEFDIEERRKQQAQTLPSGEPPPERTVRFVRDKRELAESVAAKARLYEERGQLSDALDQWHIAGAIDDHYPGLGSEIERVTARCSQQAKARRVKQATRRLEAGEYKRARKTVIAALEEFPQDPELLELHRTIDAWEQQAAQAEQLLGRAAQLAGNGALEDSIAVLRQARQLDPRSFLIESHLVTSLVSRAQQLVDARREEAESLVREALAVRPGYPPAADLASRIAERKREEFIGWCLAQARKLHAGGDLAGSLRVIEQGLAAEPSEPRLQQAHAALTKTVKGAEVPPPPSPAAPPALTPVEAKKLPQAARRSLRSWVIAGISLVAFVVVVVTVIILSTGRASQRVRVRASPPGARITIDGKPCGTTECDLMLASGKYDAEARLLGYETAVLPLEIRPGKTGRREAVAITLKPLPTTVRIVTGLTEGTVQLDQQPAVPFEAGEAVFPGVEPGKHKVTIEAGNLRTALEFYTAPAKAPRLQGVLGPKTFAGVVVTAYGSVAHVSSAIENVAAVLDGRPPEVIPAKGLELSNFIEGAHRLQITDRSGQSRSLRLETPCPPLLSAILLTKAEQRRATFVLANWEQAGGWERRGEMLVPRGKDFVLAPAVLGPGAYVFTASILRGRRLLWVANFRNEKNYCLFEIDDKNFSRSEVLNGNRSQPFRVPHLISRKERISIAADVKADSMTHRILRDQRWAGLDRWEKPGGAFAQGKFGFYLPERGPLGFISKEDKGAIGLHSFQFIPENPP